MSRVLPLIWKYGCPNVNVINSVLPLSRKPFMI